MDLFWIKIYDGLKEWQWYKTPGMVQLLVHLLICANKQWKQVGEDEVGVGCLVTSVNQLSYETGLTIKQVRDCLGRMKRTGEVTCQNLYKKGTLVTICKYEFYQMGGQTKGKQRANKGQISKEKGKIPPNNINNPSIKEKEELLSVKEGKNIEEYPYPSLTDDIKDRNIEYLKREFPRVMKMKDPMTYEQLVKLRQKGYTKEELIRVLGDMENKEKLYSYHSAYRTALKWLQMTFGIRVVKKTDNGKN